MKKENLVFIIVILVCFSIVAIGLGGKFTGAISFPSLSNFFEKKDPQQYTDITSQDTSPTPAETATTPSAMKIKEIDTKGLDCQVVEVTWIDIYNQKTGVSICARENKVCLSELWQIKNLFRSETQSLRGKLCTAQNGLREPTRPDDLFYMDHDDDDWDTVYNSYSLISYQTLMKSCDTKFDFRYQCSSTEGLPTEFGLSVMYKRPRQVLCC